MDNGGDIVPKDATARTAGTFVHPATGALILGLDWMLFSGTVVSAGTAWWILSAAGFVLGTAGAAFLQRRFGGDTMRMSVAKGLAAGVVVGLPLPVAGTAVGGWVLAASGLDRLRRRRVTRES
jgi:hypothetical protein